MLRSLLLITCLVLCEISFSQPVKKSTVKDKPPTQKEIDVMMKEMQKEMDGMSAEDKKMMDSLGIKMPSMKTIPKLSDRQIADAWNDEKRVVPKKDAARINKALAVSLTNAAIPAYIDKVRNAVSNKLPAAAKTKGEGIHRQVIAAKSSMANTAVGLWIDGKASLALYLMGEALKEKPGDIYLLNNYASFLTMCGAEELALPLLNNLNKRFPRNATILNNITQAWFGLGDMERAGKYADSTLRLYAYHPQANMTRCLIEESKGNIAAAIEAAKKSIARSYSPEKASKLKKLGYKLKSSDVNWDRPMPQDALGLGKFSWPEYPLDVVASDRLEPEWQDFKNQCSVEMEKLGMKRSQLEKEVTEANARRTKEVLQKGQRGEYVQLIPGYAAKAMVKLDHLVNGYEGNMSFAFAKELEPVVSAYQIVAGYEDEWNKNLVILDKKYEDLFGEGKPNPVEAACADYNKNSNSYLKASNELLLAKNNNYLRFLKRKTADMLYYYQYTSWPEQFELVKVYAQMAWLQSIRDQKVVFKNRNAWCASVEEEEEKNELQHFEDMNCEYVSEMNLGIFQITSKCSELYGKFEFGGVKIDISDNIETNKMNGTVTIGAPETPWESEVGFGVDGMIEFDNTGITDVGVIGKAEIKLAGQDVAGQELKLTVNSGVSQSGKGILK
jgi:hypothetical protein